MSLAEAVGERGSGCSEARLLWLAAASRQAVPALEGYGSTLGSAAGHTQGVGNTRWCGMPSRAAACTRTRYPRRCAHHTQTRTDEIVAPPGKGYGASWAGGHAARGLRGQGALGGSGRVPHRGHARRVLLAGLGAGLLARSAVGGHHDARAPEPREGGVGAPVPVRVAALRNTGACTGSVHSAAWSNSRSVHTGVTSRPAHVQPKATGRDPHLC